MSLPPHPDFAVEANQLLASQRALEAIRLCTGGIEAFPDYAGGYVLLARAYASLGLSDDATALMQDIRVRFPHVRVELPTAQLPADAVGVASVEPESPVVEPESMRDAPDADYAVLDAAENVPDMPVTQPEIEPRFDPEIEEVVSASAPPTYVLRMIETAPVADDARIIRSSSVRLIPGLEYTTLRVEGLRSRGRRGIGSLPEPPSFRSFHQVRRPQRPAAPATPRKPVSLEELAMRLTDVRMPRQSEMEASATRSDPAALMQQQPILVTDTIATIYMQQQSYDLAIEAFKTLLTRKPDRKEHYEGLIRECERKRG